MPIEELIIVPENAQYYAAFGAVMYGLHEDASVGIYHGLEKLNEFISSAVASRSWATRRGRRCRATRRSWRRSASSTGFRSSCPRRSTPGTKVRAVIGMDGGSTSSKAVLVDENKNILKKEYQLSKGNPIQDVKEILARLKAWVTDAGCELEVLGFGATGYAADVLEKTVSPTSTSSRPSRT